MNRNCTVTIFVCVLLAGLGCTNVVEAQKTSNHRLKKMRAFTKVFGYVRYFHPSDQAALVDWDAMAYHGTQQILESDDKESNEALIQRLFGPLVIDMELYKGAEKPRPKTEEASADEILAWQHIGVGLGRMKLYQSARLNRSKKAPVKAAPFGNLMTSVNASKHQGQEVRYRFKAKVKEGKCHLQGWFRVDNTEGKYGLFDNMGDRPITNKEWNDYELTGRIDRNATEMYVGVMFFGAGSAMVDDVRLEVKTDENWVSIAPNNSDFEKGTIGWGTNGAGYSIAGTNEDAAEGKSAVLFRRGSKNSKVSKLFEAIPKKGELIDAEIAPNLRIRMPLVLPVNSTYSVGDNEKTDAILNALQDLDLDNAKPSTRCLANTVLLWNVFQHFYPYFEQVDCDWDKSLTDALNRGLKCKTKEDVTETLQWLVAQLHDGHGMVFDMASRSKTKVASVSFDWIEEQLVVIASDDADFEVGDVVARIAGELPKDYLTKQEELISGSPQWKRVRSTQMLSMGSQPLDIEIKRHGNDEIIKSKLNFAGKQPATVDRGKLCRKLVDKDDTESIWYIDLGRAQPKDINDKIKKFAVAKGIVLDLRGYPKGTQYLFQHMSDEHLQSQQWQVPNQIRPDRVDIKEIETMGRWEMPPREPRFQGKMVFITDGRAISYAESCMAIVANYKLGEIIGSPTAGANGNINPFALPGGYRVSWTGMRVMNHDDSQHHVRGVQPTIPMKPTIEGIRQGKDELLEKAVELIASS